jgi:hypothetical protein
MNDGRCKLPLVSANWWPLGRAREYGRQQAGNKDIADADLNAAIMRGDVASKLEWLDRSTNPPTRGSKLLNRKFYQDDFEFRWSVLGGRWALAPRRGLQLPLSSALYVWRPHLDKIWPTEAERADAAQATESPSSTPPAPPLRVEVISLPEIKTVAEKLETPASPRELSAKEWITLEAQRLKRLDMIPVGINQTEFAVMLETNMREAARTDHSISISPVGWRYILNHLREWALWPIAIIE